MRKSSAFCTNTDGTPKCPIAVPPLPINEEVEEVWEIWGLSPTCWNTSMAGLVGLDYCQVRLVAEAACVEWTTSLLRRIQLLESYQLSAQQAK